MGFPLGRCAPTLRADAGRRWPDPDMQLDCRPGATIPARSSGPLAMDSPLPRRHAANWNHPEEIPMSLTRASRNAALAGFTARRAAAAL